MGLPAAFQEFSRRNFRDVFFTDVLNEKKIVKPGRRRTGVF
jgi:hypothetical protein